MVETRFGPVHSLVIGSADAPYDILLIHGASGNVRDFEFGLTQALAPHARVIAFDRPGLGHTPPRHAKGETPRQQAEMLDAAAEQLGVRRAVVVGHSYGGAVAMAWALHHPERVAAVVSLAGATMPWKGPLGPWYHIASSDIGGATVVPLVAALAPRRVAERTIDVIFAPQTPPAGYAERIGLDLILRPQQLRSNAKQVNGLKPHVQAMSEVYHQLRVPVEIVHGDQDTIVPLNTHSRPMAALIPGARLTVLPGIGHMPQHADRDATVDAILRAAQRAGLR